MSFLGNMWCRHGQFMYSEIQLMMCLEQVSNKVLRRRSTRTLPLPRFKPAGTNGKLRGLIMLLIATPQGVGLCTKQLYSCSIKPLGRAVSPSFGNHPRHGGRVSPLSLQHCRTSHSDVVCPSSHARRIFQHLHKCQDRARFRGSLSQRNGKPPKVRHPQWPVDFEITTVCSQRTNVAKIWNSRV